MLENDHKVLRFEAIMVGNLPLVFHPIGKVWLCKFED